MNNSKRIAKLEAVAKANEIEPLYMDVDGVEVDLRALNVDELLALARKFRAEAETEQEPSELKNIDKLI